MVNENKTEAWDLLKAKATSSSKEVAALKTLASIKGVSED
jgi:hypothetical protein